MRPESTEMSLTGALNPKVAMERLKQENSRMIQDLIRERKEASASASNPNTAWQIAKLNNQARALEERIEKERERVKILDKEIKEGQDEIINQRKKMGGINAARENNAQVQKQIKVLENRLEKAYVKYNEAVAHNKRLREQIDSLRRERLVFGQIYRKLERELQEKKRKMEAIIEKSNRAYEERDQAIEQMAQLKRQADLEQEEFRRRWEKLGQAIAENRKKLMDLQVAKAETDREEEKDAKSKAKTAAKANWKVMEAKVQHNQNLDKAQTFSDVFEKIKEETGCQDVEELVSKFVAVEDENFSLFNYVNELNQEVEKLEEQMAEIKAEIDRYRSQGNTHEAQRKQLLRELEEKLSRTEARAEQYERKHHAATEAMGTLRQGIQTMFDKLGCDSGANRELLGEGGVTDGNMMQYLGVIEQRINEILASYAATQGLDATGTNLAALLGAGGSGGQAPALPSITMPGINDTMDGDEGSALPDDVPLTRAEIESFLAKRGKRAGRR